MGSKQQPPAARGQAWKIVGSLLLLVTAGVMLAFHFAKQNEPNELIYFYDLSEQKLFTAAQSLVPPIRGINNDEEDGVRAVVIAPSDQPADKKNRKVAYLEKYSPEFKQQVETMRQNPGSEIGEGRIGRSEAQGHTFVRRPTDTEWYPLNSAEGGKILVEWHVQGPNGAYPVVCVP